MTGATIHPVCPACGHQVGQHTTPAASAGVTCTAPGCECQVTHTTQVPGLPTRAGFAGVAVERYRRAVRRGMMTDPGHEDGAPTAADDRALVAEMRARDRACRQAFKAGMAGEPFRASKWDGYPDVVAAYESGVAERRRLRLGEIRSRLTPRAATRRRVRRWARRHPWVAAVALTAAVTLAVAALAVLAVAGTVWVAGRGAAGLGRHLRTLGAARRPAEEPF